MVRQDLKEWQKEEKFTGNDDLIIISEYKLKETIEFFCNNSNDINGDHKLLANNIKVLLSEVQQKISKGTVAYTFIQTLIKGLPLLVERDVSLGPETPIEHMIRKILEEKMKFEQQKILAACKIIKKKQGQKLHNLHSTFNVVVTGTLRNNDTMKEHK